MSDGEWPYFGKNKVTVRINRATRVQLSPYERGTLKVLFMLYVVPIALELN
jgi:hypothetical protein